jgi:hypothetical protein
MGDNMNFLNNTGKYLIGAIAGIALVVGCGGGGGSNSGGLFNNAEAASTIGVTAQLFCSGDVQSMSSHNTSPLKITCLSNSSPTKQMFSNFYEITQQGWLIAHVSGDVNNSYIFYKN